MAKSSSQKFVARNRAPRVQIEYDVEVYGAEKKIQLPFVMGVMADLSGKPAEALPGVADQAAVGLAAELAVLFLVDLLEDGALIPGGPFIFLDRLAQLFLRDVEDANLQHLVGLGVADRADQPDLASK